MFFRIIRFLRELSRNLSVRAGIFCLGAVVAALLAVVFAPYVPDELAELLGSGAVDRILTILASSMLVVVTFSLSTLIASYSVATSSAPARATAIIMNDSNAQNALATFLGAFIFSVVSIVALATGFYGSKGRVILFGITILVLASVIITVIRWIGQLSGIGRLGNVIEKVEDVASKSIETQAHLFFINQRVVEPPPDARVIRCSQAGFLQTVHLEVLSSVADKHESQIWIEVYAGQFVQPGLVFARISGPASRSEQVMKEIRNSFYVGRRRTFEDDPRFGFVVLSEIGSRALSPGINDPGTAIEVIGSSLRLISKIQAVLEEDRAPKWSKNLYVRPVNPEEVIDDAYGAISRDGAKMVEVGIFLQKALGSISQFPAFEKAARDRAHRNLEHGRKYLSVEDFERLARASAWRDDFKNA